MRLLSVCLLLAAHSAAADPVGYYGNTLHIRRATGVGQLIYRPDHSFTLHSIAGDTIQGAWRVQGEKLCLDPHNSPMKGFCVADDPVHKAGDTWKVLSPDGQHETLTLKAGQ